MYQSLKEQAIYPIMCMLKSDFMHFITLIGDAIAYIMAVVMNGDHGRMKVIARDFFLIKLR